MTDGMTMGSSIDRQTTDRISAAAPNGSTKGQDGQDGMSDARDRGIAGAPCRAGRSHAARADARGEGRSLAPDRYWGPPDAWIHVGPDGPAPGGISAARCA